MKIYLDPIGNTMNIWWDDPKNAYISEEVDDPLSNDVIVKDKNILATGYNGAPSKITHCIDIGCLREKLGIPSGERHEICRGLHAEQNAIIQAALHGTSIKGSTLYCTNLPCIICSKMLINSGIERIIYEDGYPDPLAEEMLADSKV